MEQNENHAVRLEVILSRLTQLADSGAPLDPVAQRGLVQRFNQRLQIWRQIDPKGARAWEQQQNRRWPRSSRPNSSRNSPPATSSPFLAALERCSPPRPHGYGRRCAVNKWLNQRLRRWTGAEAELTLLAERHNSSKTQTRFCPML